MLLVSEIFPPRVGGSGRWLYEVYRRLAPGSAGVAAGEHPQGEAFDVDSGIVTTRMPIRLDAWGCFNLRGARNYWRLAGSVRRLAKSQKRKEIHVARCLPEGFAAWLLSIFHGMPYVVYVHGEETRTSATSRELSWMTRRVFKGARRLIANSRNTSRVLQAEWQVPADKIDVLHPGVDAKYFVPATDDGQRRQLGWQDRAVILTVGRLQLRKGQDMLIRALPRIRQQVPNVLYAIVGTGEERERLQQLTRELGVEEAVEFCGELSDAETLLRYQSCDLFALPNREVAGDFEGFGIVLLEAQACGKPVVTGTSGGTSETFVPDKTGVAVPCDLPEPLADCISKLLLDEPRRKEMGIAARQHILEHFDWPQLADQATKLLVS